MGRILACVLVLLLPAAGFGQGKLDLVREAVDDPREAEKKPRSDSDSMCDDDDDSDPFGQLFFLAVAFPWLGRTPHWTPACLTPVALPPIRMRSQTRDTS